MFGCARCGAVNDSPSKPCHRCGWDPTRTRTNDVHSAPAPARARAAATDTAPPAPGAGTLVADAEPTGARRKGRTTTAKGHPPVSGLYEPPPYAPVPPAGAAAAGPTPGKGRRVTTPAGTAVPEPVKLPVAILVVIAVLLAGLGGAAYAFHRKTAASDRGALSGDGVPGSWAPWAAPGGLYLVSFPGRPVYDTRPVTPDAAGQPILTSDAAVDLGTVTYRVTMTTLPASTRDVTTDADLLAGAVGALHLERPGLDVATGPIDAWAGLPSVAFEGTLSGADGHPHAVHGRAAVHGTHVFLLLVTERGPLANTDKFLGSFQLVG